MTNGQLEGGVIWDVNDVRRSALARKFRVDIVSSKSYTAHTYLYLNSTPTSNSLHLPLSLQLGTYS